MPVTLIMKIENLQTHPEPHVSARELAEYFHVSDTTIYKFVDCGVLDATRLGRRVSIKTESARKLERGDEAPGERLNGQATD